MVEVPMQEVLTHHCYVYDTGLGALISPLVATQFAKSSRFWSYHFIISAVLYAVNATVLWAVFRGRRQEGEDIPSTPMNMRAFRGCVLLLAIMEEEGEVGNDTDDARSDKFRTMMRLKEVHFLSFFALIYVGVEVTLGGTCGLYRRCQFHSLRRQSF